MVPLYPGQQGTVRMPARLHVKVCSANQLLGPRASLDIHDGQDILLFVGVDKDHPALVRRHGRGRSRAKTGRNGCGWASSHGLEIHAAAGFDEIHVPTGHAKIPAAVSYTCPNGEFWGELAWGIAPWWQADQYAAV